MAEELKGLAYGDTKKTGKIEAGEEGGGQRDLKTIAPWI